MLKPVANDTRQHQGALLAIFSLVAGGDGRAEQGIE
jgi:hypothetical protein